MGANLAMNPAAILTDRRHPSAQGLTNGAATLARTNQSDQGNFPGCEPVFLREKTYAATRRTRGLRLSDFYLQGQLHGAKVPDVADPREGNFPAPGGCRPLRRLLLKVAGCSTHGGPKVWIMKSSSACRRSIRLSVLVVRLNAASAVNTEYSTHPSRYPSTAWTRSRWVICSSCATLSCSSPSCRERSSRSQRSSTSWIRRG